MRWCTRRTSCTLHTLQAPFFFLLFLPHVDSLSSGSSGFLEAGRPSPFMRAHRQQRGSPTRFRFRVLSMCGHKLQWQRDSGAKAFP